jgi:hypothetical protein
MGIPKSRIGSGLLIFTEIEGVPPGGARGIRSLPQPRQHIHRIPKVKI